MDTIEEILEAMRAAAGNHGLHAVYAKTLAANDNSKNQVYLGGGFEALNMFPHGDLVAANGPEGGARRERVHARISVSWLNEAGEAHPTRQTSLILYPRYPEVRLSGFLRGSAAAPSELMGGTARIPGRVLFFGVTGDDRVLAYVVHPDSPVAADFAALQCPEVGVFRDLSDLIPGAVDPVDVIRTAVAQAAALGWTPSVKLSQQGVAEPYTARNAGGYTLEAHLGIQPNGRAEPDYEGWEIKQYAVRNFQTLGAANPVTLLTPEPDGGLYHDDINAFMMQHGYPDQNGIADRRNFGGTYRIGANAYHRTGLKLDMVGLEADGRKFTLDGAIRLITEAGEPKATWSFGKLLEHWSKKHARVAYVPSLKRDPPPEFMFSDQVTLYVGTDFARFLRAMRSGAVYFDPALKAPLVNGQVVGNVHRRCQFRVRHADLGLLYDREIPPVGA